MRRQVAPLLDELLWISKLVLALPPPPPPLPRLCENLSKSLEIAPPPSFVWVPLVFADMGLFVALSELFRLNPMEEGG